MAKDKQYGSATLTREEPAQKAPISTTPVAKPAPLRKPISETSHRETASAALPFGRQNYVLMLAGIAVILAGFFIMSLDKEEFGFGFLGLTLGPIVVMSGFVLEFFAILSRPKV
ncbi:MULTISPECIES: DUF3098 domain-containing protein [Spirosoma]|uniref:DUF3098 domain-containing protein n=1 Tax=Spirosoma liriopis TaxID=2937440 RepID=A0ABT0HML0_9BACT|nr:MULTISPECIES: DUF3098 domain-containing protein [Spirosoma]MCK8493398.1 DUF3098 domain-containing protein [Spirosoma liriopis]UHG92781.1 DUF3098 domain-containing protein [Spirosoma oryzicola]